jgi:hypothetical protein
MSRKQTGKSSIFGMIFRYYLFFLLLGTPLFCFFGSMLPREGQVITNMTTLEQHPATAAEQAKGLGTIVGGYFVGISIVLFVGWLGVRVLTAIMFWGDPEYRSWRESGGDPYFETMPGPFNSDDDETRERY